MFMKQRFYFLGYILRRVLNCNYMFNFFRNLCTVFHSDCTKQNYHQHISVCTALPTNVIFLLWMLLFFVSQCNLNWPSTNNPVTSQPFSCCVYKYVPPCLSRYVLTFWWHHSSECNVILAWYFWFFCSCLLMTLIRCPNHSISVPAIFNVFFEEMTFLLT